MSTMPDPMTPISPDSRQEEGEKFPIGAVRSVLTRFAYGWRPRRNGLGFLCWNRSDEWASMGNDEATVVMDASMPETPDTPAADQRENEKRFPRFMSGNSAASHSLREITRWWRSKRRERA